MTYTITAKRFRGIEAADVLIDGIALIGGRNGAGKSSICLAAAIAGTGNPFPRKGMTKAQAAHFVRAGEKEGFCELADEQDNLTIVSYPDCEGRGRGKPAIISPNAAGLTSPLDVTGRERINALSPYLKAQPTKADLEAALKDALIHNDELVAKVWQSIESKGWDASYAQARDRGAQFKGAWQQVTGQNYGSQKAKTWEPENYVPGASKSTLEQAVTDAKRAHEDTVGQSAVSAARRMELEEKARSISSLNKQLEEAKEELATEEKALAEARATRADLPNPDAKTLECPHCGEGIIVKPDLVGVVLEKAEGKKVPEKQLAAIRKKIATADGNVNRKTAAVTTARKKVTDTEGALEDAHKAANELDNMEDAPAKKTGKSADVESSRQIVEAAEAQLAAHDRKEQADGYAAALETNSALCAILSPDGLRKTILLRELGAFNGKHLKPLWDVAGWGPIVLTPDLEMAYGGQLYDFIAKSEQWRCRVTLQVALAKIEDAAFIVVDDADMLDQDGRNGLVAMLQAAGIPAIVAMTFNQPSQVPDLAAAELGASYWVENGIARPLAEALKEAA